MEEIEENKQIQEFQRYFNQKIISLEKINHKGNNQLFVIYLENKRILLKKYSKMHMDNWQRGKTEFKALNYLWNKGFRQIPQPLFFDNQEDIGVYSYEQGRVLKPSEIKKKDIFNLIDFLVKLHNLSEEDKKVFPPASSACLCLQDYLDVIDKRVRKIINFKPKEEIEKKAKMFLDKNVLPKIEKIKNEFFKKIQEENLDLRKELNINEQVLTPADFGFHNILIDEKEYKFLDFEYFGRDDPARQILDFIHHAKSLDIDYEFKNYFIKSYIEKRNLSDKFNKRLQLLSPLIAITWVLICLNILSKQQLEHIKFAQGDAKNIIEERLFNAERKLNEIK